MKNITNIDVSIRNSLTKNKGEEYMKRISKLFMLLMLAAGLGLGACNNNDKNPTTPPAPVKLTAPTNLQITGLELKWTAVLNASGYKVDVNGTAYDAAGAIYSLAPLIAPGNTYQIKVMAKGNGTNYTDSDWSAVKSHTTDPVSEPLYNLPEGLNVEIEIRKETNTLGVITKDVLAFIGQVKVDDPDNASRHYVSYSVTEIFEFMGISADFESAFIEASDDPVAYNTTVTSFDDAYIAVVRRNNSDDSVQTTNNFPRFVIVGDYGYVEGEDRIISNVGKITLDGVPGEPGDPGEPGEPGEPTTDWPPVIPPYALPGSLVVNIPIYGDGATLLGTITKSTLAGITQVMVTYYDNQERDYISYPLAEILAVLGISATGFSYAEGLGSGGYDVTGTIADSFVTVMRYNSDGSETPTGDPRFLAPNGVRGSGGTGASLAARDLEKITLLKE